MRCGGECYISPNNFLAYTTFEHDKSRCDLDNCNLPYFYVFKPVQYDFRVARALIPSPTQHTHSLIATSCRPSPALYNATSRP